MNGGLWMLVWLGLACIAPGPLDLEAAPLPRIATSPYGNFYVRFDFPPDDPPDASCCRIAAFRVKVGREDEELWRAEGWYAFTSWLSTDGHHLARLGPWARGTGPEAEDLAIAFHEDGRLVKSYSTRDLVQDDSYVRRTASHYEWLMHQPTLGNEGFGHTLELTTCDDITYTFDIRTGEIVDQVRRRPSRWESAEPLASDATNEIEAALREYYADLSARNWTGFASHFHDGAVLSTRWTPPDAAAPQVMMSSVAQFVARAPEGPGSQPIFEETPTSIEVRREGNMAVAWVTYSVRFGTPDALQEWTGVDAITFIRHDGLWRITSIAWAGD